MKTIKDLIDAQGYPQEIADAVAREINIRQTADRILSGELVLPHPADAAKWFDRITNTTRESRAAADRDKELADLKEQVALLLKKTGA